MSIEDFLPKKLVRTLVAVVVIVLLSMILSHFFGPKFRETFLGQGSNVNSGFSQQEETLASYIDLTANGQKTNEPGFLLPNPYEQIEDNKVLQLEYDQRIWREGRGYFSQDDFNQYGSYNNDALWQLANQGDLLALHKLDNILRLSGQDKDANELLLTAAVYGSTKALADLARGALVRSWKQRSEDPQKLANIKLMLAYSEVAAKRGDLNGIWASLLELDRNAIKLSRRDIIQISVAADNIYASLEKQREAIGLGGFDNASDALTEFQTGYLISALPDSNKWATSYIKKDIVKPVYSSQIAVQNGE